MLVKNEIEMSSPYPNMRQRDILQKLMQAEWTPHQQLAPAGEGILGNMIRNCWIECRATDHGPSSYRIPDQERQGLLLVSMTLEPCTVRCARPSAICSNCLSKRRPGSPGRSLSRPR
jgi:hypothetical protein